jgi:GTP cyclohydrolase II
MSNYESLMLQTEFGSVSAHYVPHDNPQQGETVAFVYGELAELLDREEGVPLRLQSGCAFGEDMGSKDCDCGAQLSQSQHELSRSGGILVLLRGQEGRGAGLKAKIDIMNFMAQEHVDTYTACDVLGIPREQRDFAHVSGDLLDRGIGRVALKTNNPYKIDSLRRSGLTVVKRDPLIAGVTSDNLPYLESKFKIGGHTLPNLRSYITPLA